MAQYPSIIALSSLDGTNGFRLDGVSAGDWSGWSVATAGDVNGDGYADLIIGAPFASPGGGASAGSSYVVFGAASGFGAAIDLSALNGTNGFRLDGVDTNDVSGWSVASAGDVNGDGVDDIIVGAKSADPNGQTSGGASYVVFGTTSGFSATVELSALNGTDGFMLDPGSGGQFSGVSVASAGDVNGDGIGDLVIGASAASPGGRLNAGMTYVVFGKGSGFTATLDLSALNGTDGFRVDGATDHDQSGSTVASAGDVNGDGFDDIIIGANLATAGGDAYAGSSYVVFGGAPGLGFPATLDLSALDGTNGFRLDGVDAGEKSGFSVASAGDINGDGYADLIVGAPFTSPGGTHWAGSAYVVFGKAAGFSAALDLSTLDGNTGFRIDGVNASDYSCESVASAGDVNGDGFDDIVVGVVHYGGYAGAAYVVFGKASGFSSTLELSSMDGTNGFRIDGVASHDIAGDSVSAAGDVNGDGLDDLLIGAFQADPGGNTSAGSSYVVFGREPDAHVKRIGTDIGQHLVGGEAHDKLVGMGGDDVLYGNGFKDKLSGGYGQDTLIGGAGRDTLVGGPGIDTFMFKALSDSPDVANADIIQDLINADIIDLSAIDADTGTGGDQAFHLVGAFSHAAGELRVAYNSGTGFTLVQGDVDGDGAADLTIKILGDFHAYHHFVL